MKKILYAAIFTFVSLTSIAQTAAVTPLTAEFKYNDAGIQKALADNKLEFALQNISNTMQLDKFVETTTYYKNDLHVNLIANKSNTEKVCSVTFLNNTVSMGTLLRLFVSNSINEVTFDGQKMTTQDFFNKYGSNR